MAALPTALFDLQSFFQIGGSHGWRLGPARRCPFQCGCRIICGLGYKPLTSKNIRPAKTDKVSKVRRAKDLRVTIHWATKGVQPLRGRASILHRRSAYLNQDTDVRR